MWKDVQRIEDIPPGGRFRALDKETIGMLGPYRDAEFNTIHGLSGTRDTEGGTYCHHIITNAGLKRWQLQVWQEDTDAAPRCKRFKRIANKIG